MIFRKGSFKRMVGETTIPTLGGGEEEGIVNLNLNKETGVVFIAEYYKKNNQLYRFQVGYFNTDGDLLEKRDYGKTEKDFFEAVNYFEELIQKRNEEEKEGNNPPSVGRFYFFKPSIDAESRVVIDGLDEHIVIDKEDIPNVFSPPKTKPYGRLNLTDTTKDAYEPIRGKFALKYNEERSKELAQDSALPLSDCAVYDMTPYEVNDEEDGEPPSEVNDDTLSPDDIEDEDLNKRKEPKEHKEDEEEEDDEKDDGEDEDGEDEDGDDEDGDDEDGDDEDGDDEDGEDEDGDDEDGDDEDGDDEDGDDEDGDDEDGDDEDGDDEDGDDEDGDDEDGDDIDEDGEPDDEDDDGEDGDDEGGEEDDDGNDYQLGDEEDHDSTGEKINEMGADNRDKITNLNPNQIIGEIEKFLGISDINSLRRQSNLQSTLDIYSESELQSKLANSIGMSNTASKDAIIDAVLNVTQNILK